MNKIIKRIIFITIIMCLSLYIKVNAANETEIKINPSQTNLEPGQTINIQFNIENISIPTSNIKMEFRYNKNIFEKLTEDDFNQIRGWNLPTISVEDDEQDNSSYYVTAITDRGLDTTTPNNILNFNLKVKEGLTDYSNAYISIEYMEAGSSDGNEIIKENKNINYTFTKNQELYLSTEKYKIGENNTGNYEDGDKYIYRISPETKISDFINNLSTNGNIRVYNANGEEEADYDKLIGTGMILKVTKDNQIIELVISVLGDIDGNGEVTPTDVAESIQKEIGADNLNELQILSVDIDENKDITPTDIAEIIKLMIQ